VGDVRSSLDTAIEMFSGQETAAALTETLKKMRAAAAAKNFNFKLFSDIMLGSLFAAIIAMFITKLSAPRSVSWFSDRDKIITSNNRVADALLSMHFYQACHEYGVRCDSVRLVVGDMSVEPWYDDLIRVPDFIAGALSAFDRDTRCVSTQKHFDLLTKVISDAPNIATIDTQVRPSAFRCQPSWYLKRPPVALCGDADLRTRLTPPDFPECSFIRLSASEGERLVVLHSVKA
jgi:hypothetical protein